MRPAFSAASPQRDGAASIRSVRLRQTHDRASQNQDVQRANAMTLLSAIIAGIALLIAVSVGIANWGCVIASERNRRKGIDRHHSVVPAVSLLLAGAVAYPLYPFTPRWWIWLIPALDIGTWLLLVGLPWAIVQGMFANDDPDRDEDGPR